MSLRKRAPRTAKPASFKAKTYSLYAHMKARHDLTYEKRHLEPPEFPLSLPGFRSWYIEELGLTFFSPEQDELKGYGRACCYCGLAFRWDHLQVDHIVPIKRRGAWTTGNLALCCKDCNQAKGAGDMDGKQFYEFMNLIRHWPNRKAILVALRVGGSIHVLRPYAKREEKKALTEVSTSASVPVNLA